MVFADGSYTVKEPESSMFSDALIPKKARLFKIEIGGSIPNTKISTVVILN